MSEDQSKEGYVAELTDAASRREAAEAAFDYRGDVTLTLQDGSEVAGFLYDRDFEGSPPRVRILPADGSDRRTIPLETLTGIAFTGKDMAAGRSFDAWMKKYEARKRAELAG